MPDWNLYYFSDNITSTKWPEADEDIPTYTLEFSDGWQPPDVTAAPESYEPIRREEHQRPAPSRVDRHPEHPVRRRSADRLLVWAEEGER